MHGRAGLELRGRARVNALAARHPASPVPHALRGRSETRPGRTCPLAYRYEPRVRDRAPEIEAETVYVVGGLYGNVEALDVLRSMAAAERGPVRLVFNGDFHWFDVDPDDFARIDGEVLEHCALRGNVETEIAGEDSGAGCGCAYPVDVSDAEVGRSNEILERLRGTARMFPELRERFAALPMHRVARVGDARIGIVHGDASSLAGWGFARDRLDDPAHRRWIESAFRDARVDVFASSHTCLPALRRFATDAGGGIVANNGAAGMPNFAGTGFGLATRISVHPLASALHGLEVAGVHVQAVPIDYDAARWRERFLAQWPAGSAAHASYFRRIVEGPRLALADGAPRDAAAA
jgi:hypothetical protein